MSQKITLGEVMGEGLEEDFKKFDLTEIKLVLDSLQEGEAIDLAHAEQLQQQSLRGADIISNFLARMIKTTSYLETKINSAKNKASLEYTAPEGRTTADMKIWAGSCAPEVEKLNEQLAMAKGSKSYLEKKYDILIKAHHHFKDIAMGLRRTVLGYNNTTERIQVAPGWE